MKAHTDRIFNSLHTGWLLLGLGTASGCGMYSAAPKTVWLSNALNVPAASGKVELTHLDQGKMRLAIHVDYLAPPDEIARGATTYVAWAQPEAGGAPQKLGALAIDEHHSARLVTKTADRAEKITLTPEPGAGVTQPSHAPVLWATLGRG